MISWNLETFFLESLRSYSKNPRIVTLASQKQLKESLDKFGLIDRPIVNQDMEVIGGHQRLEILRGQGVKFVEAWVPDRLLTPKEVEELNIRLNRSNFWDFDALANNFDINELLNWGFDEEELGMEKPEKKKKEKKPAVTIEFESKETMLEYVARLEMMAEEACAKLKIRG